MKQLLLLLCFAIFVNKAMQPVKLPSFNVADIKCAHDLNRTTKLARFLGGFILGAGTNLIIDDFKTANLIGVSCAAGSTYAFNSYINEIVRQYGLNEHEVFNESGIDVSFGYFLGLGCGKFVRHCLNNVIRSLKNRNEQEE